MPVQTSEIATPRPGAQQQVAPTTTPPAINEAEQLAKTNAYLEQLGEIIVTRQSVASALANERSGAVANLERLAGDSSDSAALMRMFGGGYGKDLVRICGGFDQALDVAKTLDANTDQQLQGLQLLKDMVGAKFTEAEMGQFFSGTLPAARVEQLVDSIAARKLSEKEALEKQYGKSTSLDEVNQVIKQEHETLKATSGIAANPQDGAIVTSSGEKIASLSADRQTVVDKNGNETTLEALSKDHPQIAARALQNSLHTPNGLSTEALSPTVIDGVAFLDQHSRQDALNFVRKSSANAQELFNQEGFGNTSSQEHQKQLQALTQLREDNRLSFMGSTEAADILSYVDEGLSPGSVATGIFTGGSTLGVANTIGRASGAIATDVATDGAVATGAILNGIDPRKHPVLAAAAGMPVGYVGALGRNFSSAVVPSPLARKTAAEIDTLLDGKINVIAREATPEFRIFNPEQIGAQHFNANVKIGGKEFTLRPGDQLAIGDDYILRQEGNGIFFLRSNRESIPSSSEMFTSNRTHSLEIEGTTVDLEFTAPRFNEVIAMPMLNIASLQEPDYISWSRDQTKFDADHHTQLLEYGKENKISAHGVEERKGGLQNLIGIAATGKVGTGADNSDGFFGPLTTYRDPSVSAGAHGPFYVISKGDGAENFQYVVPDETSLQYFREGLTEVSSWGLLNQSELDDVMSRSMTYDQFMNPSHQTSTRTGSGALEADAKLLNSPPAKNLPLINSNSSMAEDLATVPAMPKEDAMSLFNQLGSNPDQRINVVYGELAKLGWSRDTLHNNFEKSMSIVKNQLNGSKTEYAVHGTSAHALNSILEKGLNSLLGPEVNGGVMMRQPGVAWTTDIDYARSVADDAAEVTGDEPLLVRWKLDAPEFKDKVGFSPPISPERLEISRDNGATWSSAVQRNDS